MTAFAGLRGTGDFGTDERPKSFREMILFLDPNGSAPLFALTSKMASSKVTDPEFAWWQESLDNFRQLNTGTLDATTSSTTITFQAEGTTNTFGSGLSLVAGDLLQIEKTVTTAAIGAANEIVLVSSVTSATVIVVQRGALGTTLTAVATATGFTKIGNIFEEGATSPTASSRNPTKMLNYTQIWKTAYEMTRTASQTKYRTGDVMKNERIRKMFDHAAAIEYSLIFGRRSEGTGAGGKPKRSTGGLLDTTIGIPTYALATSFTEDTLLDTFEPLFRKTAPGVPAQRIAFCGNGFLNNVNKVIKNSSSTRLMFDKVLTTYGMNLQNYIFPYGEVGFKTHPLLNNHPLYRYSALVIAPPMLEFKELQPTVEQKNIQANDADEIKNQWLTEAGLEIRGQQMMAHLHLLQS